MITAILTVYNRSSTLLNQIQRLHAQTKPPQEIWIWKNQSDTTDAKQIENLLKVRREYPDIKVIDCLYNFKYHGRFAIANLVRTEYVAILDDDMFPEPKWFENCLKSIETHNGIMGGMGVRLSGRKGYSHHQKFGWQNNRSSRVEKVDICCQSWFFRKQWLKYMWLEEPLTWENGEDIHFSYLAKKHGNIQSYVPPHPISDTGMWSSDIAIGNTFAADQHATWRTQDHFSIRDMICSTYLNNGWKIVLDT